MSDATPSATPVTELKVSGHLMTLNPGVFCVFNTPGATPPDAETGLPGVRISAAPAKGRFTGEVALSGFSSDGWMGAALTFNAPLTLRPGQPLRVRYAIYVHAGRPESKLLEAQWQAFAREPLPVLELPGKKK